MRPMKLAAKGFHGIRFKASISIREHWSPMIKAEPGDDRCQFTGFGSEPAIIPKTWLNYH